MNPASPASHWSAIVAHAREILAEELRGRDVRLPWPGPRNELRAAVAALFDSPRGFDGSDLDGSDLAALAEAAAWTARRLWGGGPIRRTHVEAIEAAVDAAYRPPWTLWDVDGYSW